MPLTPFEICIGITLFIPPYHHFPPFRTQKYILCIRYVKKFLSNHCILNINILNCNPVQVTSDTSSRPYQGEWFDKYDVIEKNKIVVRVICNEKVTSRTYNVKKHFETQHSNLGMSTDEERKKRIFLKAVC